MAPSIGAIYSVSTLRMGYYIKLMPESQSIQWWFRHQKFGSLVISGISLTPLVAYFTLPAGPGVTLTKHFGDQARVPEPVEQRGAAEAQWT